MPAYVSIVIVIETLLLLILAGMLIYKSSKLSSILTQLLLMKKDAEKQQELQHERDDFLAMLVHELRSPLAVMKGAADLMLKEAANLSKDQIEMLLAQIRSSSIGMLKIVNDILDISKLESGKFTINKMANSISLVLHDESDYFQAMANSKQIKLSYLCEQEIPSFQFDADRIKQVLNNLISNAIKFTPENGNVSIDCKKVDNQIKVVVSDTGEGISDQMKHKLFHKFVQLNNHQHTKERGTGLGLVISKGIIEAHGGKIWVEDNHPQGSQFIFTLPLA